MKAPLDRADVAHADKFDTEAWRLALMREDVFSLLGEDGLKTCRERLARLQVYMTKPLHGRKLEARVLVVAAISQVPLLLLGPPGTAKSALVHRLAEGLGLRGAKSGPAYFEYLLTEFTEPNEVLGPVDLKLLEEKGKFRRDFDGHLPSARLAFLDEIFKANSAILNVLLTILNERHVYVGGKPHRVPLEVLVAAANEVPRGSDLGALYDRFPVRLRMDSVVHEHADVTEVLSKGLRSDQENARRGASDDDPRAGLVETGACLNHVLALGAASRDRFRPERKDDALVAFGRSFAARCLDLKREGEGLVALSDRKILRLYRLCCASAELDGRIPDSTDLGLLEHTGEDASDVSLERIRDVLGLKRDA